MSASARDIRMQGIVPWTAAPALTIGICCDGLPAMTPAPPALTARAVPLILGSGSPRRRELLERIGVPIEVHAPEIDERATDGEPPAAYVARIARAKAAAIARPGRWVLAADTTVTIDGAIL